MTIIAAWNFDNVLEGSTVYDDVGNHNGIVTGSVPLINSAISSKGREWTENDASNRIEIPDHNDLEFTGDRTLELWMTMYSVGSRCLISKGDIGASSMWGLYTTDSSEIYTYLRTNSGSNYIYTTAGSRPVLTLNIPYYISFVYDDTAESMYIYINGRLYTTAKTEVGTFTGCPDNGENLYIGAGKLSGSPGYPFDGAIHAVRFSNHKMTPAQIYNVYNGSNIRENN